MLKNKVVVIGMPGCGKSTLGKILAEKINYDFCDMDDYIQNISKETIPQLFEKGEDFFRKWETTACEELIKLNNIVIATGGGVVKKQKNIDILKDATIVFIDRSVEDISKDVDVVTRPLLRDGVFKLYDLYNERYELYKKAADIIIKNDKTIDEVIEDIELNLKGKVNF